jgi:hypothetical protein
MAGRHLNPPLPSISHHIKRGDVAGVVGVR